MKSDISADDLRRAASIKDKIETLEAQAKAILEGAAPRRGRRLGSKESVASSESSAPRTKKKRRKRKLSPEARARIVAAAKARWARAKGGK